MQYILMMSGTKAQFDWYAKWSKEDLQAHFAFMHAFNKELKDTGVFVSAEGLAFPREAKIVRAGSNGSRLRTAYFPNRRSSWLATGSSTWRKRSKPTGLRRARPRHRAQMAIGAIRRLRYARA
jgi:hypothetical protein